VRIDPDEIRERIIWIKKIVRNVANISSKLHQVLDSVALSFEQASESAEHDVQAGDNEHDNKRDRPDDSNRRKNNRVGSNPLD